MSKYTVAWAEQYKDEPFYQELRDLIAERLKINTPKCGCKAKRLWNMKVKNRTETNLLERRMLALIGDNS